LATSVCFGSHVSAADILTLLIKASARVIVYRGTVEPSYLPGIKSLFIMCMGIVRNNFLVGRRARAEARTLVTEHVTLYCTWWWSALITRPHGQVNERLHRQTKMLVVSIYNVSPDIETNKNISVRQCLYECLYVSLCTFMYAQKSI